MKKLATTLLYLASISSLHTYGQIENWRDLTPSSDRNFFDIQQAFEMEFGGVPYEKGRGIKQYRRWEYYWENRVDVNGNFPAPGKVLQEFNNYQLSHPTPRNYVSGNGNWSLMGPIQKPVNGTGQPNGNGRVNSITFHPTDSNIIILGTPGGGVFKSNDNGNSWNELNNGLIRLGVSDIDFHPTVPDTIYIATGDKDGGDSPGYGVWRSSDGGNSWNAHNTGMGDRTVFEILIHPNNPRIMLASTAGQKFYRSTDGGETWTNTYNFSSNCKDLAFHPTNPNIIYAAGPKFYRSTDNGLTFTEVNSGLPTPVCRIAIGVTPNQPDWIYLFAGGATGSGSFEGIYRSTDAGQNFSLRTSTPNIMGYNSTGNDDRDQCGYDICLAIDPNNANILYAGSINIWKSVDGGSTMSLAAHWTGSGGADDVHADHHDLQYSPHNGILYNANDGGIYFTADSGTTWDEISSGLYIAQVYKIGVAQVTKDLVINGYQDNGTAINNGSSFRTEIGGDGFESIIDPLDENFMYGALYYGDVRRSNNGGLNFSTIAENGVNGIDESGGWVAPYTLDPNNNARMYIGYKNVWRSDDVKSPAANAITWTKISNFGSSGNLIDIAVAPSNSNVLYVSKSLNGSRLFKTNNATATSPAFSSLQAGLPNNANVKDIAIDPVNPDHLFIAQSNKIYESTNGGTSWTDVSGTLPDISLNTIVLDYESSLGAMYVGMDLGIYYKDNSMTDWVLYNDSLPNVEITELEIHYSSTDCNSKLYASTYGQGLWASDLKDPGNQAPIACFEANQRSACASDVITLTDYSSFSPLSWSWSITPNTYSYVNGTDSSSQNPSISFTNSGNYTITLAVTNSNGTNSVTKNSYINVLPSDYACAYDENFDTQAACGTSNDCAVEICNLSSNWANLTNGTSDDIDWRADSAGTASSATGPTVDFSLGTSSGMYLYLEASGGCTEQTAILESGCVELNQNYNLLVRYHMLGSDMGSLHFDIYSNGLWTQDFVSAITGDQGNSWLTKNIDLSSYNGQTVKLRIRGVTGQGFGSDLAIDAIEFQPIAPTSNPVSACDSLVSPSGNYVWNVSGIYTDTITGNGGCDSIVSYNLTINSSISTSQSLSGCDTYDYNGTTYTSSTTITENLTAANGCDSTVNTTININPSATTNQSFTGCDSYVYNGTTYTSSTTVTENLTASNGCDSTVNTTITINPSVVTNLSFTECDSVDYNGAVYTVSGIYTSTFPSSNGCDSIVNIQVNILNEIGREWAQVGQNIDGEASNDESGQSISFSRDATRLAIGAPLNDGNGSAAGHVRIFDWNGSSWVQLGQDIDGENSFDQSGGSISLSGDGNRIAIGARLFEPANAGTGIHYGHVRIFQWDGTSWTQLGQDINAARAQDEFGTSVSFSNDGNRIAIGGPGHDEVLGVNSNYGHVRVFDWDGSSWIQVGQDIDGPTTSNGRFGRSLCLSSDGSRLAVGSLNWRVKVYDWDGSAWTQIGPTLIDGLNSGFGNSLSFSDDGITLAIGIPSGYSNGLRTGKVRAFQWDGVTWNRLGQDINGETDGEESGHSVSISGNGSRLAIGAKERSASLNRNGYVRIYDWDGSSWAQVGQDVAGEASFDRSGQSVALSKDGSRLAVGATGHDGPGFDAGHVKVYQLRGVTETAIFDTTNVIACDNYTWTINSIVYSTSGTYYDTLYGQSGCDSVLAVLNLTINPSATTNQSFTGCDSYVYNGTTYTSSTTVTENLFTIAGCDSTINTTITINPSATTNQSFVGCDSYVYNGTTYTSSTTVTENLFTGAGCDSTVNTTITITPTPSPPAANGASIVAGNSATLSASGAGSGQSYAWLTSNGTLVGNGASYTTPILNTTTIYFVEISDDASNCTSSRTTVIVTVTSPDILWTGNSSNDWNVASNWSTNLVPSLSDSITIPSNNVVNYPIIQNDVTIGHTTVEALASITIAPNGILRLSDELINNGLVLLQSDISGDGVLIDTVINANFVGSLSIERYNPGDQFHIIGSPVASSMTGLSNDLSGPTGNGLTGSDGLAVTPDLTTSIYLNSGVCDSLVIGSNYGNLFSYDESLVQNCSFEGWVVESAGTLVPGKGYMAYLTPGGTLDLDGPPNTGSITGPSLTNSGGTTFTGAGWNLVSNPYPSYFDVEEFIVDNNGVNSPNVFVDTGLYSGTYSSILPVTGQSVVALGQGFVIRNGGDNATPAINPLYSNAMRETSGTGFRSPASNRLKVDVIQDNLRDKTEIYWAQGGQEGFHRFEDGYKFTSSTLQPQIGSLLEDELMAVQTLPKSQDLSRIIPLVVKGIEASLYSIEVNTGFIPLDYHVFLVDNIYGQRYNARILPEISFQNLGNEERRFDIEITKSSLHADDLDFLENIEVYQSNNQLIVAPQNTSEATYRIEVYDVLGRCLMTKPLTAGRQVILLNTPSQLLNIRLSSGAHQHTVKTWWQVD